MIYKIRLGGTNEFVSDIDPEYIRCIPKGKVDFVEGWDHKHALTFKTYEEAKTAADKVWDIEGFHTTVEKI